MPVPYAPTHLLSRSAFVPAVTLETGGEVVAHLHQEEVEFLPEPEEGEGCMRTSGAAAVLHSTHVCLRMCVC